MSGQPPPTDPALAAAHETDQEDRAVEFPGRRERVIAPRMPVHRVVGVLTEIEAGFVPKSVHWAVLVWPWCRLAAAGCVAYAATARPGNGYQGLLTLPGPALLRLKLGQSRREE